MATIIEGILHDAEIRKPWTKWKRCFMVWRKESITGKLIWGFGWMRECNGIYEYSEESGFFYVPGKQYAKNKKEIFIQGLKKGV